ncbi:hypothetical protein NC653_002334 [Populus alba x Populus x berolinensis]|uniref:Uncharacterized protein n=1 Tax=Populus alba x Populus x berolinensis TaxID=444605 RepID=A0AAD6RPQ7_9ROSI|nr:hypothetical protein NC653_002334 [Populus alba x Populus x berolinensis]
MFYVWLMIGLCCILFLAVEFFRLWLCFSLKIRSGYAPSNRTRIVIYLCTVIPLWFHSAHVFISMLSIY